MIRYLKNLGAWNSNPPYRRTRKLKYSKKERKCFMEGSEIACSPSYEPIFLSLTGEGKNNLQQLKES